jgi:hypothetical protein
MKRALITGTTDQGRAQLAAFVLVGKLHGVRHQAQHVVVQHRTD